MDNLRLSIEDFHRDPLPAVDSISEMDKQRRANLVDRCAIHVGLYGKMQFELLVDVGDFNRTFKGAPILVAEVILRRKAIDDTRAFV